jgi:hypothetical protein
MNAVQIDVSGETDDEAKEKEEDSLSDEVYYERLRKLSGSSRWSSKTEVLEVKEV